MRPGPAFQRAVGRAPKARLALLLATGSALAGCSSSQSLVGTGLPSLTKSCASGLSQVGTQQVPISEETTKAGPVVVVTICIDRKGPYPFAVSTGAGASVISPALQRSLKLQTASAPVAIRGATCTSEAPAVAVQSLTLAGISLAPQHLLVASVPAFGTGQPSDGVIGSDVLSRFGAVRIDYRSKTLTLARSEEPAPTGNVFILGQSTARPPSGLVKSAPEVGAVLDVIESPANTLISSAVTMSGQKKSFLIDSGSPNSVVATTTSSSLGLAPGQGAADKSGIGCSGTVSTFSSGPWVLGTSALPNVSLLSETFVGIANKGIDGALGSDVLSSYHSVVIDYGGAHLWLGAG